MADDVDIKIGATLDDLIESVESAKGAIGSITELVGVGFTLEGIKSLIEDMGRLGEEAERSAAMLGMSTTAVQQLGLMAQMSGGSSEQMVMGLDRLQLGLVRSQGATSAQAAALKSLGINTAEFVRLKPEEQVNRLADAFAKFADGGTKTADAMLLLGRAGAQMIPQLDLGSAGMEALRQKSIEFATVMTGQTVKSLVDLEHATVTMRASLSSLSAALVALASPVLVQMEEGFAKSAAAMTEIASTGNLTEYVLRNIRGVAEDLVAQLGRLAAAIYAVSHLHFGEAFSQDMAKANATAAATHAKLESDLKAIEDRAAEAYKAILKVNQESAKPQAPTPNLQMGQQLKAAQEAAAEQIKLADTIYQGQVEHINASFKLFESTEAQKTAALQAALLQRYNAELNAVNAEIATLGRGTEEYKKAIAERTLIEQKFANDSVKINDQAMEEQQKTWKAGADQIAGAFNSQLKGLLAGTTSFASAMKSMLGDMIVKFIGDIVKWGAEHIATEALMTAATATGVATRTALTTGGKSLEAAASADTALEVIAADVAKVFANLASWLTAAFGPAGIPIALGLAAGVGAVAVSQIKHFDVGTDYVPQTGLAMLHQGEAVIPAAANAAQFTGTGGGGGTSININAPMIGTTQWLNSIIPQLSRVLRNYENLNPSAT